MANEKNVIINIPRDKGGKRTEVVWVNSHRYEIRKGINVSVPAAVAEILDNREDIRTKIYAFEDANQK